MTEQMTPDEFRATIYTLWPGNGTQTRAAEYLGVGSARVREWLSGRRPIPASAACEIRELLVLFPDGLRASDPRRVIAALQQSMARSGWTAEQSAASILGAAWGNIVKVAGRQNAVDLMRSVCEDGGNETQ